jgi:divalent metal cation (Fe/Co/Zn/Cd) transporter
MLIVAAFSLAPDASSLLVVKAATTRERQEILAGFAARPEVEEVLQLLTMALAPDRVLVAARVDLRAGMDSELVEDISTDIDRAIRARVLAVSEVFLDATDRDRFSDAKRPSLGVILDEPA